MFKAVIFDLGNTLVEQDSGSLFPFAAEVLQELKKRYKLGLITNTLPETRRDNIMKILQRAGLQGFFDHILVSSELGFSKPDPRIFQIMFQELDVKAEEAMMVGNMISTDIFGGNRVGMETVLIQLDEKYMRSEWETPNHTIGSLQELTFILMNQNHN